ncbi:MAG: 50S ribosomal protein L25 [bacterium]|nr:50S ribosomal protein L25 [bacterium]
MEKHKLIVSGRKITGKKVKKLRQEGLLPANVYGKAVKSSAVQVPIKDFEKIYKEAGETGLVELSVEGEEKTRPVLIHNLQINPVTRAFLHCDFYQVDLKEKIKASVPVVLVGEAKAVTSKIGLLLQTLNEVEVEALPADLPEKIEVNVESLAAVDEQVTVGDLKVGKEVTILTAADQVVVKISELVSREAEKLAKEEAATAEAAAAETGAEAVPTEEKPVAPSDEAGEPVGEQKPE